MTIFTFLVEYTGHQWVQFPNNQKLLVPNLKVGRYGIFKGTTDIESVIRDNKNTLPGGVIDSEHHCLYSRVTSLQNVDISELEFHTRFSVRCKYVPRIL